MSDTSSTATFHQGYRLIDPAGPAAKWAPMLALHDIVFTVSDLPFKAVEIEFHSSYERPFLDPEIGHWKEHDNDWLQGCLENDVLDVTPYVRRIDREAKSLGELMNVDVREGPTQWGTRILFTREEVAVEIVNQEIASMIIRFRKIDAQWQICLVITWPFDKPLSDLLVEDESALFVVPELAADGVKCSEIEPQRLGYHLEGETLEVYVDQAFLAGVVFR